MDKMIWSDGHTTTISSEEAFRRQYEVPTDNGSEWRMRIDDTEFAWHANCWMDISYQKKLSMKNRLVLCFDNKRFGTKTFYLCSTEEEALNVAEKYKENYNKVEIVAVPDDLQS